MIDIDFNPPQRPKSPLEFIQQKMREEQQREKAKPKAKPKKRPKGGRGAR